MHGTILTVTAIFERLVHGPVAIEDIDGIRRTIDRAALPFELRTLLPLSAGRDLITRRCIHALVSRQQTLRDENFMPHR